MAWHVGPTARLCGHEWIEDLTTKQRKRCRCDEGGRVIQVTLLHAALVVRGSMSAAGRDSSGYGVESALDQKHMAERSPAGTERGRGGGAEHPSTSTSAVQERGAEEVRLRGTSDLAIIYSTRHDTVRYATG